MTTIEHKPADGTTHEHYIVRLQLSNGRVAGEGYGPTPESAWRWAIADASHNRQENELGRFERRCKCPFGNDTEIVNGGGYGIKS